MTADESIVGIDCVLFVGDLADGFKWVACVGKGELAHYDRGGFGIDGLGCSSELRPMISRTARTHARPFSGLQIGRR